MKAGGSLKGYEAEGSGKSPVFGVDTSGEASANFGNGEASTGFEYLKFESEKGQWKDATVVDASAKGSVSAADLKASGSYGIASGEAEAQVLSAEASVSGKVKLMEEGKLAPQIALDADIEGNVAKGSVGATIGNDYIDAHVNAEGEFLHAEANAGVGAGKITYKDENGKTKTAAGVYAKAGAEAYVAKGSIGGGINILGVKIDVSAEGKLGGAGATANAEVSSGRVKAGLGLGFLAGLGLDVTIDWSGFKWPKFGKHENGESKTFKPKKGKSKGGSSGGSGKTNIVVYPQKLKANAQTVKDFSGEISRLSAQVEKIKGELKIEGAAGAILKKQLGTVVDNMKQQKKNLKNMSQTLEEISKLYIDTETTIMSNV